MQNSYVEGYRAAYRGEYRSSNPCNVANNARQWDAGFVRAFARINAGLPCEYGQVTPRFAESR